MKIPFYHAIYTYEFGQPLQSIDEGVQFLSGYHSFLSNELKIVRDFIKDKAVKLGAGYYLPSTRTSEVFYWYTSEV